jgi:hypothetical protein
MAQESGRCCLRDKMMCYGNDSGNDPAKKFVVCFGCNG